MSNIKRFRIPEKLKDQQGVTIIIIGIVMFMLVAHYGFIWMANGCRK